MEVQGLTFIGLPWVSIPESFAMIGYMQWLDWSGLGHMGTAGTRVEALAQSIMLKNQGEGTAI